ncbi:MAG: gliding motility-associated protein GldE [Bacteroidales bacterium]
MDTDLNSCSLFAGIEILPPSFTAIIALIAALGCLFASAFISSSETSFFSLSPEDKERIYEEGNQADIKIRELLSRGQSLLATILIANNFVNVSAIILLSVFFSSVLVIESPVTDFIFQSVILTFILLICGEVVPKTYARGNALKISRRVAPYFVKLERALSWLSRPLIGSTSFINKRFTHKLASISMNDLSQALEVTAVDGGEEKRMLEGIITFGGKTVQEIMTARVDITDVEIGTDFKSLLDIVVKSGYSRMPVYEGSEDNIRGVIYIKDLLPYLGRDSGFDWASLLRPAYFVPETKMIDDILEDFRRKKIHMAIVVDEFGGTSGVVTLEDVLEEIVGEISDEYDDEERPYVKLDDNTYIFEGKIALGDFYKATGLCEDVFEEVVDDAETVAGLVLSIKEDFPKINEVIKYLPCKFTVIEMDKRRIVKVKIEIIPDETRI